jgi:hypothetical protein
MEKNPEADEGIPFARDEFTFEFIRTGLGAREVGESYTQNKDAC